MRNPAFRKLPLDSFIGASSRLTKAKLQLEGIFKYSPADSADAQLLPTALSLAVELLQKIDCIIGQANNRLKLLQIEQDLSNVLTDRDKADLQLGEMGRQCIRQSKLMMKRSQGEAEYNLVLLDNAVLIYRKKADGAKVKAVRILLIR